MKKIKLFTPIISSIALAGACIPAISCGTNSEDEKEPIVELFDSTGVTLETTKFELNKDYSTKVIVEDVTLKVDSFVILIDGAQLLSTKYMYDAETKILTIRGKFMVSKSVKIKVNLAVETPKIKLPTDATQIEGETVAAEGGWVSRGYVRNCEFTNLVNEHDKFLLIPYATVVYDGSVVLLDSKINWTTGNKFDVEVTAKNAYFYGSDPLNDVEITFKFNTKDVKLGDQTNVFNFQFVPKIYAPEGINVYPKVDQNGVYSVTTDDFMIVNPSQEQGATTNVVLNTELTDSRIVKNISVSRKSYDGWDPFWFGVTLTITDNPTEGYADGKLIPAGDYHVYIDISHTFPNPDPETQADQPTITIEKKEVPIALHILEAEKTPIEITPENVGEKAMVVECTTGETKTFNYNDLASSGNEYAYEFYGYGADATIAVTSFKPLTPGLTYKWNQNPADDGKHQYNLQLTIPALTQDTTVMFSFQITISYADETKSPIVINFSSCGFIADVA